MRRRKASSLLIGLAMLGAGAAYARMLGPAGAGVPSAMSGPVPQAWSVPDITQLPDDDGGRLVRRGQSLIMHTAASLGPQVADPARRFAGNDLDCQSCHLDGGTRKFGLPLVGAFARYPSYRPRSGKIGTIEDRVNGCMTRSLNGRPLPENGADMAAIVAYLKFLSTGTLPGSRTEGQGPGPLVEPARAADPARGRQVFAENCAACHGAQGEGMRGDGDPGYAVPPLWGAGSFNDGAGMARLINAASFIRNNMPHGTTWSAPALSVDDAWDVAAYIESRPRPHKANLEQDYPDRREKPVDAAYGPFADNLPASQHKYGPFAPIRAALKALPPAR